MSFWKAVGAFFMDTPTIHKEPAKLPDPTKQYRVAIIYHGSYTPDEAEAIALEIVHGAHEARAKSLPSK